MSENVLAYRIFDEDVALRGRFVTLAIDDLDAGDVVVKVAFSSVNFKDALATTPHGHIIRRFPCIGGIDLSGTVMRSTDRRFQEGDEVIATSYGLGVSHDGGYATHCRLPADWVVPKPAGLSLWESMALGTAGYTVALAVMRMEQAGLHPSGGPVIVTGASGGVGSLAVDMLSARGYSVTALTGKRERREFLTRLGASEVLFRDELDLANLKPLEKSRWAGAIDNLGGTVLSWLTSTMRPAGVLALIGQASAPTFQASVMPWILRGISALGISSTDTPMPQRAVVWEQLGVDLKPPHLHEVSVTVPFGELRPAFEALLGGGATGRTVVAVDGGQTSVRWQP